MQPLRSIDPANATGKTKELLDFVQHRSSRIPNMVLLMANSPAALGAYLNFAGALRDAALSAEIRDLIAVAVAQVSGSDYTLSAVCATGRNSGRSESDLAAARVAEAEDAKSAAALRFAVKVVEKRGQLPASEVEALRAAGFSDGEVVDIVATVVLNIYRNYFNLIARPEIDFPIVRTGNAVRT